MTGLTLVSCAGAAPVALPVAAPVATAVAKAPFSPDLSPVPEPGGLVVYAHASHPAATLKSALDLAKAPLPGSFELSRELAGEDIGDLVDPNAPVDLVLINGGAGMTVPWAAAASVRSLDAVRAALPRYWVLATGDSDGSYVIRPAEDAARGTTLHPCEVTPSAGPSRYRLVCGASRQALGYLAPFLARTAPLRAWDNDAHVELYTTPLKPFARLIRSEAPHLIESMLGLGEDAQPTTMALVKAVLTDLVDLVGDLDKVEINVALVPEGAHVAVQSSFSSRDSMVARVLTSFPERASRPTDFFWRLPKESDTAVFSHGYDPKDLVHARDLLVSLAEGALSQGGLAEADRKAIAAAFDSVLSDAPFVVARGSDTVAMQKALVEFRAANETAKAGAARAALEPYVGWWVLGSDEPPARLQGVFRGLSKAMSRPGVAQWLKSHVEGVPPPTLRIAAVPPTLPHGTMHAELAVHVRPDEGSPSPAARSKPGVPAPPIPLEFHVLIVPEARAGAVRTWMVVASDLRLAVTRARELLNAEQGATTLSSRRGLDALQGISVNSGGFTSLRAWVSLSPEPASTGPGKAGDPLGLLASLPSQGESPIVFSATSNRHADSTPTSGVSDSSRQDSRALEGTHTMQIFFPRAALEDIALFFVKSASSNASGASAGGRI
jgi:hypothetical protein